MARSSRKQQTETAAPGAIVASAVQLSNSSADNTKLRRGLAWQGEAWKYYDLIGEYRYACDWVGAMLSKATLKVQRRNDETSDFPTEGEAVDLLEQFFGGKENQVEMLRQMGVHLTVAGECYVIGWTEKGVDEWMVAASVEVTKRGKSWFVSGEKIGADPTGSGETGEPYVLKVWIPHPRRHLEATSPSKAILPILGEIHALTQHVGAQVISRLAGAGILLVSTDMKLPTIPESEQDPDVQVASDADQLMTILNQAMSTAIADRESASAVTPIVVQAPSEAIEHIKHLTFWTQLDEKSVELRSEAIRRLALGLDMPPEILTGTGDMNHWNAWLSDESAIKAHTGPLLTRITGSLTRGYLLPMMEEDVDDGWTYSIAADDSQMRLRPNRSKEALELWDRNELGAEALRRETGFDTHDAPGKEERKQWFLRKIASGSATPEQVEAALHAIGITEIVTSGEDDTRESRPAPSLDEHPRFDPPDDPDPGLVAAADVLCLRALERAGNRMKSKLKIKPPGVAASALYQYIPGDDQPAMDDLLEDAWTHVPEYAARFGVHPDRLTDALDTYCRLLIAERADRDEGTLRKHLALVSKES